MAYPLKTLRNKTDDELIAEHDEHATHTVVGTDYYREELERRSRVRAMKASNSLARRSFWLGVISSLTSLLALAVAIVAIFIGR